MPESTPPSSTDAQFRSDVSVELVKANACDSDVVWAARVSTAGEQSIAAREEDPERNAGLIRYLMRDRHGSPFEHNSMTFLISAPIFVFREFMRHRVGWCVSGDTLVTTDVDGDVPVEALYEAWHRDRHDPGIRVLNEQSRRFGSAAIYDVIRSGVKKVVTLRTEDGHVLRCTRDHALLTSDGWVKAGDLESTQLLSANGEGSSLPGSRSAFVAYQMIRETAEVETYDLAVEGPWHNFLANGIVVHNSYNEESGRYRQLQPVFYVPGTDRKLVQEGKPGAYEFVAGTPEQHKLVVEATEEACRQAYRAYLEMLDAGIAREVARGVLPVGTFSSMYATCNARSLMHFLALRTKRDDARFPSFPQREIELVAEGMEAHFARLMPIVHAAFEANGRVAP